MRMTGGCAICGDDEEEGEKGDAEAGISRTVGGRGKGGCCRWKAYT